MQKFIIKGFQYFLMFQLSVLVAMAITTFVFVVPIRFFVENKIARLWLQVAIGFVLEITCIIVCFYREKITFKNSTLIKFASPCIIGGLLHFILAYLNGFYVYTAGISVSELGILWQSYYFNHPIKDMRNVELFRLIIPFLIILVFRISAVFLGYYLGKRKINKIKHELIKE